MKKIELLIVLADASRSGAPMTVCNLARTIDRSRFTLSIIAPPGPMTTELAVLPGLAVQTLPMHSKWDMRAIMAMRRMIRQIKPDLIDCQGVRAGWLGRLAVVGVDRSRMKVVYTEHLWTADYHLPNLLAEWWQLLFLRLLDRLTDQTIAVSQAVADFLVKKKITKPDKVTVCYSGIEMPQRLRAQQPNQNGFRIGCVASLTKRKGVDTLLRAIPMVREKLGDALLTVAIAGTGPEEGRLRALAQELEVTEAIEWLGSVADVSALYPTFDIYVQPSLDEAFGLAVLEAMSYGRPVVASKVGGLCELLDLKESDPLPFSETPNGILVEPRNALALAEALSRVLADAQLAKTFGEHARTRAEIFSLQKTVKEKEVLYEKIAK